MKVPERHAADARALVEAALHALFRQKFHRRAQPATMLLPVRVHPDTGRAAGGIAPQATGALATAVVANTQRGP